MLWCITRREPARFFSASIRKVKTLPVALTLLMIFCAPAHTTRGRPVCSFSPTPAVFLSQLTIELRNMG